MNRAVQIDKRTVAAFCRRHHIRELSFFGSCLGDKFRSDSDIDVLVEFEPRHVPGMIHLFGVEQELSHLLGGRRVDLVTKKALNPRIRDRILAEAEVEYAQR